MLRHSATFLYSYHFLLCCFVLLSFSTSDFPISVRSMQGISMGSRSDTASLPCFSPTLAAPPRRRGKRGEGERGKRGERGERGERACCSIQCGQCGPGVTRQGAEVAICPSFPLENLS